MIGKGEVLTQTTGASASRILMRPQGTEWRRALLTCRSLMVRPQVNRRLPKSREPENRISPAPRNQASRGGKRSEMEWKPKRSHRGRTESLYPVAEEGISPPNTTKRVLEGEGDSMLANRSRPRLDLGIISPPTWH